MQQLQQGIGQIASANTEAGFVNLTTRAELGQLLYFMEGDRRILCRITWITSSRVGGTSGRITFLDTPRRPPRMGTDLFLQPVQTDSGIYFTVGTDTWERPVSFRLQALFKNVLVAGKTQGGKTHLAIVIAEELIRLKVPHLIIDTQDEFTGLIDKFPDNVVVTRKFSELIETLRSRKTVIVSLMAKTEEEKLRIVADLIWKLKQAKEKTYKDDPKYYPPIIVTIDEAELYAPTAGRFPLSGACRAAIESFVKRDVKFGLGTILLSQRPAALQADVRTQCNSGVFFLLDDTASLSVIKRLGFVTRFDADSIPRLQQGEAFSTGKIVPGPVKFKVRDITVKRTKNLNFEDLLYPAGMG